MALTYLTNYTNATLECVTNVMDNVTTNVCHGTVAVVPYNQDAVIVLQMIQTCLLVVIALIVIVKFALARR